MAHSFTDDLHPMIMCENTYTLLDHLEIKTQCFQEGINYFYSLVFLFIVYIY